MQMLTILWVPLICSILVFLMGVALTFSLNKLQPEKNKISELTELVSDGLNQYSKRILSSVIQLNLYLTALLLIFSKVLGSPFHWNQILAFTFGSILMVMSSHLVFRLSPQFLPKILHQSHHFLAQALKALLHSSLCLYFLIIGLNISGLLVSHMVLGEDSVIGFTLGVTLAVFFIRVGGGLFKAAADIGSDTITTIDPTIPENDHRSPATILDLIGSYIGNINGYSADILSSYIFSFIACLILPIFLSTTKRIDFVTSTILLIIPIVILTVGLISSLLAVLFCKYRITTKHTNNFLLESIYLSSIISGTTIYILNSIFSLPDISFWGHPQNISFFLPYVFGLIGAVVISFTSEFLTSYRFKPVRNMAKHIQFGPAVMLLSTLSNSLKSNGLYLMYILLISIPSYHFAGFYGIALSTFGMLSVTTTIIMTKIFSPLANSCKKYNDLYPSSDMLKENTAKMDRIGGTTAALGNGFATGAATLSTFSLFFSIIALSGHLFSNILIVDLYLLSGLLMGIMLPFIYSGFLISGLTNCIKFVMGEVSRQFKEIPYLYEDKAKPDIRKAADTLARKSLDALIIPGMLMVIPPILIGQIFGVKMLVGFVLGTFLTGFNQGFYWANYGDSINSIKSLISKGHLGGKESPNYPYIIFSDNYGDSFKDLLNPGINIFIKAVSLTAILILLL